MESEFVRYVRIARFRKTGEPVCDRYGVADQVFTARAEDGTSSWYRLTNARFVGLLAEEMHPSYEGVHIFQVCEEDEWRKHLRRENAGRLLRGEQDEGPQIAKEPPKTGPVKSRYEAIGRIAADQVGVVDAVADGVVRSRDVGPERHAEDVEGDEGEGGGHDDTEGDGAGGQAGGDDGVAQGGREAAVGSGKARGGRANEGNAPQPSRPPVPRSQDVGRVQPAPEGSRRKRR